jgi:hypothetical protein
MLSYDINVSEDVNLAHRLELLQNILLLNDISAVMAFEQQRFLTIYVELGFDGLVTVAYTRGVCALDDVVDGLGQFYLFFSHNLIVTNNVDASMRRNQGDLVYLLRLELSALYLDNVLAFPPLTGHVNSNSYGAFLSASDPQDPDDVERVPTGYMIYHRAILDF